MNCSAALDRLMATAKTIRRRDRRLVLSLIDDLRARSTTACTCVAMLWCEQLNIAGNRQHGVRAYSRKPPSAPLGCR